MSWKNSNDGPRCQIKSHKSMLFSNKPMSQDSISLPDIVSQQVLTNLGIQYVPIQDQTYITNHASKLTIQNRNQEIIHFLPRQVSIEGDVHANVGQFVDVYADNLHLLNELTTLNGRYLGELQVNDVILTNRIRSLNGNLRITAPRFHAVSIPNTQHDISLEHHLINPEQIKSFRLFIVSSETILNANDCVNGIEIIIYNNSVNEVTIKATSQYCVCPDRDNNLILVTNIPSNTSKRFVYVKCLGKWIIT